MKKYLLIVLATLSLTACANSNQDVKTNTLDYNGNMKTSNNPVMLNVDLPVKKLAINSMNGAREFEVEVASTDAQRKIGLMNRKSIDDNKGMLFIFGTSGYMNFWMKNTLIPLDIVFIDSSGYIKHIAHDAKPCTAANDKDCPLYNSNAQVKYVLELKAGMTDKLDIKEGDRATWI